MNRRTFIASVAGGAGVLAGCTTTGNSSENRTSSAKTSATSTEPNSPADTTTGSNRIAVDDMQVAPGDTGTVSIKAKDITKMIVSPSLNNPVPLDYENVSFSKHSKIMSVAESYPPEWHWSSPQQNVTVTVPFQVPADTQSGTYNYSVTISNESASSPDSVTEEFTMTVT